MFSKDFVPTKPFPDFKWKWACLQCTEGINDPVILLGVLFRMRKLEGRGLKYSSQEFADELVGLSDDISDSIGVDFARRTGERNIIRNSGQYWRAVGLIPDDSRGLIRLTDFGRRVAEHDISQTEFSAITVQTFKLPNSHIQPFKYNGEDTIANGFAMRTDIHTLFDAGHLRISETGVVELSTRARMDYGAAIPPRIVLPDFTNRDFIRWRWENYNGL